MSLALDGSGTISSSSFSIGLDGSTAAKAAYSAQDIWNLSPSFRTSAASGWYWIKGAGSTPYYMYCSMGAGGGWMLWMHYRDPFTNSFTLNTSMLTTASAYNLTDTTTMFVFCVPAAIADISSYIAVTSSADSNSTNPTNFSDFKYVIQMNSAIRNWVKPTTRTTTNGYGTLDAVAVSTIASFRGNHYRYGESFNVIQYGHNQGGGNEFETLNFRNINGTGSATWSSSTHIWDYSGWGAIDASNPGGNGDSTWGSNGSDGGGSWNRQDHLYCWLR